MDERICIVEDCNQKRTHNPGYCPKHNYRAKRYGDPLIARTYGTGDNATISGVHRRLYRKRGSAKAHSCVDCGKPARHWCYDHSDPSEKHDPLHGPYSTDIARYHPRCVSCHKRFDVAHIQESPDDGSARLGVSRSGRRIKRGA